MMTTPCPKGMRQIDQSGIFRGMSGKGLGMPIQQWSEGILLVDLANPPQFSDEIQSLELRLDRGPASHVILNFQRVDRMNSTNLSQVLRLRKRLIESGHRLRLCSLGDGVWGIFLVAGLDKFFDFSPDVSSALAAVQLGG